MPTPCRSLARDVFVERLFGLTLTWSQVERGRNFVHGVLERLERDFELSATGDDAAEVTPMAWPSPPSSPPPTTDPNRRFRTTDVCR